VTIETDQTTQTNEQTNSEATTSSKPDEGSSTSTTETADFTVDDDDAGNSQVEDARTDEEKAADAAKAELFGAPAEDESYAIEGLPDGMEIDTAALEAVTPAFRELGLSSKGASLIAKTYAEKVLPSVMENATKQIETQVVATRKQWEDEAIAAVKANGSDLKNKAGEVLSFDAKDLKAVRATAAKALDRLAPEGFRDWLRDSGLSVHPMMLAFAYQAGKHIAEDTDIESAERGDRKPKSRVEKYYGQNA
jgi:hypothetical protein